MKSLTDKDERKTRKGNLKLGFNFKSSVNFFVKILLFYARFWNSWPEQLMWNFIQGIETPE